jgi:hypothetical protein
MGMRENIAPDTNGGWHEGCEKGVRKEKKEQGKSEVKINEGGMRG